MKVKYLILGAGPAGLTVANTLKQRGEDSFLVLEKESEAGGLCRSTTVDGSPFDIGGGHFLDVRRPAVNEFLFGFMPRDEWDLYDRKTSLVINGVSIGQPIEAHIWELPLESQVEYLKSIAVAGCNLGTLIPEKFVDWIYWKLGKRIAEDYMIPYNQKMFGKDLDLLGTYWLDKLPNVSFEETLLSCLEKKPYGKDPGHTQFLYPKKYGYGEVWLRMADALGDHIEYGKEVSGIDFNSKSVIVSDGEKYEADIIVTTVPWMTINDITGIPDKIKTGIGRLKYSSIQTQYHEENLDTDSQWIYYPDPALSYHRILVRHNFCPGSKGYWTETNKERVDSSANNSSFSYMNKFAYPLNTLGKPEFMKELLSLAKSHDIYGLGRWGEHSHYNSDVTVELALKLAESI
ncbi:MAG: FAD-dependent oxidoreductase [Butyrivibrio sp.]|nr:FAD-dependent oxidoreductase [Butyrivibrio sp.]